MHMIMMYTSYLLKCKYVVFCKPYKLHVDVYAVYWDPRFVDDDKSLRSTSVHLRILALGVYLDDDADNKVQCVFAADTGDPAVVPVSRRKLSGRPFGGHMLSCEVPRRFTHGVDRVTPPCNVKITNSVGGSSLFKIINTFPPSRVQREFTVCTPPLFGENITDLQIVEFMELMRLLGADHVMFYDSGLSLVAYTVLKYYVSIGRATLLTWNKRMKSVYEYHIDLAVTDCLYRNMALSKYVVYLSIHEFLVPYKHTSWHDMMEELDTEKTCAFRVSGVYFDPRTQNGAENVTTSLEHTWRTNTSTVLIKRTIVKPQMAFDVTVLDIEPFSKSYLSKELSYPDALVHFHKHCPPNSSASCMDLVPDGVIYYRYYDDLELAIDKSLERIGSTAYLKQNKALLEDFCKAHYGCVVGTDGQCDFEKCDNADYRDDEISRTVMIT